MPVLQPDTSEMQDFDPSEPNTYRARIEKVDLVKGKEKGTPGIQPFLVFDAPRKSDGKVRTVTRKGWHAVSGPGAFTFDQLLRCTGFADTADEIKARPGQVGFDTDELVGKEVNVVIGTGIYRPKDGGEREQDEIKGYLPA